MTDHGIPATSWQLEAAAAGRLKAIVLPVTSGWAEGDFLGWPPSGTKITTGFNEGDRIYLQEFWIVRQ